MANTGSNSSGNSGNFFSGAWNKTLSFVGLGKPGDTLGPYAESPSRAHAFYIQNKNETGYGSVPYLGFQYYARIRFNEEAVKDIAESTYYSGLIDALNNQEQVPPMIKSVSIPGVNVESEVFSEYNRKRLSQSKLNFDPIKMTFHDTTNGLTSSLWHLYYSFYFNDGAALDKFGNEKSEALSNAEINPSGAFFSADNFGYNSNNVGNLRNLISRIEVMQIHSSIARITTMYNPIISNFSHDTLAYESSDAVEVNFTFEYEYLKYTTIDMKDGEDDALVRFFDKGKPSWDPPTQAAKIDKKTGFIQGVKDVYAYTRQVEKNVQTAAKTVAGKYQQVASTYNNLGSSLPFDLGRGIRKNPAPSSRPFTKNISCTRDAVNDFDRSVDSIGLGFSGIIPEDNTSPLPESVRELDETGAVISTPALDRAKRGRRDGEIKQ